MNKIEHLQAHRFGIGVLIREPDILQRTVRHMDSLVLQHLPPISVEGHKRPGIALRATQAGRYFPARSYLQRAGKEHAPGTSRKHAASREDAENRSLRLCGHRFSAGFPGRHTGPHHIQPVSRKFQGERLCRCHFTAGEHHFPVRSRQFIADRQRRGISPGILCVELERQRPGGNDLPPAVSIGRIPYAHIDRQILADIPPFPETVHLAACLRYGDIGLIIAGLHGREGGLEAVVRTNGKILLQDGGPVALHAYMHARPGKAVAGVADELAAYGDIGPHKIEPVQRIEGEVKGGEHEFVYAEATGPEAYGFQFPSASAVPFRDYEAAAHRAPRVGGEVKRFHHVVLGIVETDFHLAPLYHLEAAGRVAVKDDGLELQGVAGIVGTTVLIDIAPDMTVIRLRGIARREIQRAGATIAGFDHQLKISPGILQVLLDRFRKRRKAVQLKAGAGNLLAVFEKRHGGAPQRNAGLEVGHIHAVAAAVLAGCDRERVLLVHGFVPCKGLMHFQRVFSVGKHR